jgi:hypothetical protein
MQAHDTTDGTELTEGQGLRAEGRNGNFWQVHIGVIFSLGPGPLPLSHPEPYEMAEFVSPWQCFGGVPDFVSRCLARF